MSVYNGGEYLRPAVDSVLTQTFNDFEFIIFDDGSTDESRKILESFADVDARIRLVLREKNTGIQGFTDNLNEGIQMARGKYIARMDADDVSLPNRLLKQFDFLEKNHEIFLLGSAVNIIDKNSKIIDKKVPPQNPSQFLVGRNCIYHPTIMFRNEKSIRYRNKLRFCEDYDLYLRLLSLNKKLANTDEVLLSYRVLKDSVSRTKSMYQYVFSRRAVSFYNERVLHGVDSYADFDPGKIIVDPYDRDVLYYQIKASAYLNDFLDTRRLCLEFLKRYPLSGDVVFYLLSSLLPAPILIGIKRLRYLVRNFSASRKLRTQRTQRVD